MPPGGGSVSNGWLKFLPFPSLPIQKEKLKKAGLTSKRLVFHLVWSSSDLLKALSFLALRLTTNVVLAADVFEE